MRCFTFLLFFMLSLQYVVPANADELTRIIQVDLKALGYEPGNTDGELSTETIVAISKFQAENDLEVTGEATPQLAGVIKAAINNQGGEASLPEPAQPAAVDDAEARYLAQQACLKEKMAARQEAEKKKRGFGKLLNAVGRTASRFVDGSLGGDIAETTGTIYDVNATAEDLEGAAEDLGLTQDDLEDCRNPQAGR